MKFRSAAALGALLSAALAGVWINSAPSGSRGGLIEIAPGSTTRSIAGLMREKGLIRSPVWLELMARVWRADQKLKAGVYRVGPGARTDRILRDMIQGRGELIRVTIPEGFAVWQMAERLAAAGVCEAADFSREAIPWEGFLFPETYFFDPGATGKAVADAMRARMNAVWKDVFAEAADLGGVSASGGVPVHPDDRFRFSDGRVWTVRQAVTLASLVERETRLAEERPLVAGVYHNRLKKRMRLECDPTVQYALGGWKNPLYKKDLEVESPYNTYRRYGLPPGPIASPGRGSLAAALAPAAVDYLYFVSDAAGGHRFSSTYAEHQQAVRLLRRALKAKRNPLQ